MGDLFLPFPIYAPLPSLISLPSRLRSATNSLSSVRGWRSVLPELLESMDTWVPAGIEIRVRVSASDNGRSVRGWRSVPPQVSSGVRVPSGIKTLMKALMRVGILASIKIPARIRAPFRIPSIRIPVRTPASIMASPGVRNL